MTQPVTGIITTPPPTTTAAATKKNDLLDPQAFLQLLVAQLQYQDPSNPADTSTFLNQTAMLSQVQTMNGMSDTLASLTATQQGQAATGLIGKQITYLDLAGAKQTGVVDSAAIEGSTATLKIGNVSVGLDKVLSVANAPAS